MDNNILLIGFMGVGKGAVARELAKLEGKLYALDTDDMIESMKNMRIKKIFANEGEEAFRKLEQKTADWLFKNVSSAVISTGGGFYKVRNIKSIGTVVYLRADFKWILQRIKNAPNAKKKLKKRPLFQDPEKAEKLFCERYKEYEKVADIIIDVSNKDTKEIAKEILKKVQQ